MSERFTSKIRRLRLRHTLTVVVGLILGFVALTSLFLTPGAPETRLPAEYRINALIDRQGSENEKQRREVHKLQTQIDQVRDSASTHNADVRADSDALKQLSSLTGGQPVTGRGITVSLTDSTLSKSESGAASLNDLVIHSQDVQAVVNAMWASRAEAIAVNGQRLIGTSAVLCVGNTLLINGTVHAPPFVIAGVGVDRDAFENDAGVKSLQRAATRYGLGFSVSRSTEITIPAYDGATVTKYARAGV